MASENEGTGTAPVLEVADKSSTHANLLYVEHSYYTHLISVEDASHKPSQLRDVCSPSKEDIGYD